MNRPETIEETAALVDQAGGRGIAVQVDHLVPDEVRALVSRIDKEQGPLHILVNDIWGPPRWSGTNRSGSPRWIMGSAPCAWPWTRMRSPVTLRYRCSSRGKGAWLSR
jgi:hypothetical protein